MEPDGEELHDLGRKEPHTIKHQERHRLKNHLRNVLTNYGADSLEKFEDALEEETEKYLEKGMFSELSDAALRDKADSFVGDMFEMFVELFLNYYANGEENWPRDYESRNGSNKSDMGADGRGRNRHDLYMAVQVKYRRMRGNPNRQIEYSGDHLANLIPDAWRTYKITYPPAKGEDGETFLIQHCIVSNAAGTTLAFKDATEGLVATILRDDLSQINGDLPFWEWVGRFNT